MEATPAWEDKSKELQDARQRLEAAQTTLGTLHAKQGRRNQFATQKERDAHLNSMIQGHGKRIGERESGEKGVEEALEEARKELDGAQRRQGELRGELDGRKEALGQVQGELVRLKEEHRTLIEKRK